MANAARHATAAATTAVECMEWWWSFVDGYTWPPSTTTAAAGRFHVNARAATTTSRLAHAMSG
jgi:hypothetical protein